MPSLSRRTVLGAIAAGSVVGLAGCSSSCPDSSRPEPDQRVSIAAGTVGPLQTIPESDWSLSRHDPANTGFASEASVPDTIAPRWRADLDADRVGGPVVAGSQVFLTDRGGLTALDVRDGATLWRDTSLAPTPVEDGFEYRRPTVAPAVGEHVVVGAEQRLAAFDPATGEERWSYEEGTAFAEPRVVDGTVYAVSADGLVALGAATGEERWTADPWAASGASRPAVADGTVVVVDDREVVAVAAATGEERWTANVEPERASSPVVADGTVYVGSREGLVALDGATGEERWTYTREQGLPFTEPVVTPDTLYAVERPQEAPAATFALDRTGGEPTPRWCSNLGEGSVVGATTDRAFVLGGSSGPGLTAFTADFGEALWEYGNGDNQLLPPAVVDGLVVVAARDGTVTALGGA